MQLLELLWDLIRLYFSYKRNMEAIRSGQGAAKIQGEMIKAYMKGDYQTAHLRAMDPFYKGVTLMELGKPGLALQPLMRAAETAQDPRLGALANNVIGQLLSEDQQYDRALEKFHYSRILWPERGECDRGSAEVWLRKGGNSAEALRLARRGVEKERAHPNFTQDAKNASLSEQLGTLAWAVAVEARDAAEVDRLAAEALPLTAANPASSTGQMHLHFGHAYAALGQYEKSGYHYREAARIDPNGRAGRAAAKAMPIAARA